MELKTKNVAIITTGVVAVISMIIVAVTLSGIRTANIELQCMRQGGHWEKVESADFLSCEDATPTVRETLR